MNRLGKKHSQSSKCKISKATTGKNNPFYGKKHSIEARSKISLQGLGRRIGDKNPFYGQKHTIETIKKLSKKVIDSKTGIEYDSVKEAAASLNIGYSSLRGMLNGNSKNKTNLKHDIVN